MLISQIILKDLNILFEKLSHKEFYLVKDYFENNKEMLFERANIILVNALEKLYVGGYKNIELRRLSATFRRGDLMSFLEV